jgi:predicted NodU family carbamoyl transferase
MPNRSYWVDRFTAATWQEFLDGWEHHPPGHDYLGRTSSDVEIVEALIVHVDGSARVQTVKREVEPLYDRLISKFYELTGAPLLLNTSFNGCGEQMLESTRDAVAALSTMGLDALAVGDFLITKTPRPE